MKQSYFIQGIKCMSCIDKITTLLQNQLSAANINISDNNQRLEFNISDEINITTLNQLLSKIGNYSVSEKSFDLPSVSKEEAIVLSYKPIYLIFTYLVIVNGLISLKNPNLNLFMTNFMASFFLVFSFF